MKISRIWLAPVPLFALTLSACGGGGGSSASPAAPPVIASNPTDSPTSTPPPAPGSSLVNLLTTYTVYTGVMDTLGSVVQVSALSDGSVPSGMQAASVAPGALVYYPDGSVQVADALGNFDASQSSWAVANAGNLANDPTLEPEVVIQAPVDGFTPLDTFVDAFEPNAPQVMGAPRTAASALRAAQAATPANLKSVVVLPNAVGLFDTEQRIFHAVGIDTNGKRLALGNTSVTWSLNVAAGCTASAAGSLRIPRGEQSKIIYNAPNAGTYPAGCPDLVIATVVTASGPVSGQGSALYRDHKRSVKVSGTLVDLSGKPVPGAIIDLYGASSESTNGKGFASTNARGEFNVSVDSTRTLTPVVATRIDKKLQFSAVLPASIQVPASGLSGLRLTLQAPIAQPTPRPVVSPKPTATPKPAATPSATGTAVASATPAASATSAPTAAATSSAAVR